MGMVSLRECAKYLTDKFAQEFTEHELQEWCDAEFLPHVKVRNKGVACYVSKVEKWVTQEFVEVCEGKPFPWGIHRVYLNERRPPSLVPVELVAIFESLSYLPLTSVPSCVYFLVASGKIVYVGQSNNLLMRIGQHKDKSFDEVYFLPVPASHLNQVEQAFIRTLSPLYNGTHSQTPATYEDRQMISDLSSKQRNDSAR